MKFIASAFIAALLAYTFGLFMPWWSIALAGCITGALIPQKRMITFLSCFLGIFLFWGIFAFLISTSNDHILAHRVSLLVLKKDNPIMLIVMTALIGGFTSGISAFTGRSFVIMIRSTKQD
jgi:hypothetical protein